MKIFAGTSEVWWASGMVALTVGAGAVLAMPSVAADDSAVTTTTIEVPSSCSLESTIDTAHVAEVPNGIYSGTSDYPNGIGQTTLRVYCNDNEGFSIYAVGYTGEQIGATNSTKLVGDDTNQTIDTGTATSGNSSAWAMKLNTVSSPTPTYPITLLNGYDSFSSVPANYAKVATRTGGTDTGVNAEGSALTTTYAVYIASAQTADTYRGKVKYTMVHPNDHAKPVAHPVLLGTGATVNSKLKSLAATVVNGTDTTISYSSNDSYIKAISVHLETPAPAGFTPSEKNTVSSSASSKPIYIVFDNTNDAGVMHFYTEGDQIVLPANSSDMFYNFRVLADLSDIADWNAANVTSMDSMFTNAGYNATTFTLDLSSWNTASVTNMSQMFTNAGYNATTFTLDLSSWNTASVTNMSKMFRSVGRSATTFTLDFSSWNAAGVTDMSQMFYYAGASATTFALDLSSWNVANVTNMSDMFFYAGEDATTFTLDLPSWNTASAANMSGMFQGAGRSATTWAISGLSSWNTAGVANMHRMFYYAGYSATTFTLDLSSWNTASVTDMSSMFFNAGHSATTWSLGDLSSWNTASVTDMQSMFYYAGYSATTFTLDLSSWNTASVPNMTQLFCYAGYSATTFTLDLSSWNTAGVTNMYSMFYYAGYSATTFTLNLSSWNTAGVTSMTSMFSYAGPNATTWSVTIPQTNGNNVSNTTSRLYGQTTSTYGFPPGGKSFTLAQP